MNHSTKRSEQGFTIIELMLAMAFVAALLLTVALTIVQIGTIYNKGMTLKEVNQTGRTISDDLRRSVAASSSFNLATNFQEREWGGRFCTGQVSYLWNYAQALQEGDTAVNRFASGSDTIRLLRVPDAAAAYCVTSGAGAFALREVSDLDREESTELLRQGDRTLSIHELSITSPNNGSDPLTGQSMYSVTFTIGTGDTTALNDQQTACLPPGDINANFAFCAVQQFTIVTRAGNRVN